MKELSLASFRFLHIGKMSFYTDTLLAKFPLFSTPSNKGSTTSLANKHSARKSFVGFLSFDSENA